MLSFGEQVLGQVNLLTRLVLGHLDKIEIVATILVNCGLLPLLR